jgi:Ni,Fe-hydrogenase III small subunit
MHSNPAVEPPADQSDLKQVMQCYHANIGACNGCDLEVLNLINSFLLASKRPLELVLVRNLKNADLLLATGSVSRGMVKKIRELKESLSGSKPVIAIGTCAIDGGPWKKSYNQVGGIDKVLPVSCLIPGCPPTPEAILQGIEVALGLKKLQFVPQRYHER